MKVEDLMIEDWVCLEDENLPLKERYFKIEYIAISAGVSWVNQGTNASIGLGDGESLIPVFIDEISPIPLTPEILNKNGFVNSYIDVSLNKDSVYKYNHFYTGNSVIVDMESNKLIVKYENDIWMNLPYSRTIYVHELQHVLKHCDIKKEIIICMEFIFSQQNWKDKDGKVVVTHTEVMEENGYAHCRISHYPGENAQILSNVYVEDRCRNMGICTVMLKAIKCVLTRPHTIVYVDEWAPEYVKRMYKKQGFIILNN